MGKHHSTLVPERIRDQLVALAGRQEGGVGGAVERILATFRGRLLEEVVASFPAILPYFDGSPWVRLGLVLPPEVAQEIVDADRRCGALQRMYLVGLLLAVHEDDLEALIHQGAPVAAQVEA